MAKVKHSVHPRSRRFLRFAGADQDEVGKRLKAVRDQFNFEIPQKFRKEGISASAANAIVNSETWTDANPMFNLSSFVTPVVRLRQRIFTIGIYIEISPIPTYIHRLRRQNSGAFQRLHDEHKTSAKC
jgi:hypothetical protein